MTDSHHKPWLTRFCERHQDNSIVFRRVHIAGIGFMVFGFLLFNLAGFHHATQVGEYYAKMGLIVTAVLFIFGASMLMGPKKQRLNAQQFGGGARILHRAILWGVPPIVLATGLTLSFIHCLRTWDWYTQITITATEPVKEELRWLLGDAYPEEQEVNIDPETLGWRFTIVRTGAAKERFLKAHSPSVIPSQEGFFEKQLNQQSYTVRWSTDGGHKVDEASVIPDWEQAEIFGFNETENPNSYPVCELRVPIRSPELQPKIDYEVFINGKHLEGIPGIVDHDPYGYHDPAYALPGMIRIKKGEMIIRTNFMGSSWPIYCLINYPENNRSYSPEPITDWSMTNLNQGRFQLHFYLLGHLRESEIEYYTYRIYRLPSYDEFFDALNRHVAFNLLDTTISSYGVGDIY